MPNRSKSDLLDTILASADSRALCGWCRHPDAELYRSRLCRHCYKIKTEIANLERQPEVALKRTERAALRVDFRLRVAKEKRNLAQHEGRYHYPYSGLKPTPLDIERQFCHISKLVTGKDMFRNYAGVFQELFPPRERQALFYVLSLIDRAHQRKHRARNAARLTSGAAG